MCRNFITSLNYLEQLLFVRKYLMRVLCKNYKENFIILSIYVYKNL